MSLAGDIPSQRATRVCTAPALKEAPTLRLWLRGAARDAGRRPEVTEEGSKGEAAPLAPTPPIMVRVAEAAAFQTDHRIEPKGPISFALNVDGMRLTAVVKERRHVARTMSPRFPVSAYEGDLTEATNDINAEHIACGGAYVWDAEVRDAAEVLIEPSHADVIPVAFKAVAGVARGLRMEVV